MRIMRQHNRSTSINFPLELLKTNPIRIGIIILIVLRINTSPDDMVSQISHGAEDDGRMSEERGAHVGREEAQDAHEGFFENCHLVYDFFIWKSVKGGVVPSV